MAIQVHCEQCKATLRAPDSAAGKRIRCPRCSNVVLVEVIDCETDSRDAAWQEPEQSRHAVIVVSAERLPLDSDVGRKHPSDKSNTKSLQNTHFVSARSVNRTVLPAIIVLFTVILISVAASAYWLGRSFSDSERPVASHEGNDNKTAAQPVENVQKSPPGDTSDIAVSAAADSTAIAAAPNVSDKVAPTPVTVTPATPELQAAPQNVVVTPVIFEPLLADEPITSLTMSEDGQFVMMSHQTAGRVSIFDVAGDKITHVINSPSPRALLSRGDQLFVGNFGEGKISVYSAAKGWTLENELQVTKPNILYMSAARSDNFGGEILVTCHGPGNQASYQDSHIFRVDASRDRCEPVSRSAVASMSFDGKNVLSQGSFNLSPSGDLSVFSYDEFVAGDAQPIFRGGISQTPFVYQSYPGSYWLSENMIFGGAPIALVQDKLGSILIPDALQKVVYVLDENSLSARRLNSGLTEVGDKPRKIRLPADQSKSPSRLFEQRERRRHYLLDHPVAVTQGNVLTIFILDQTNGAVLRAKTAAFADVAQAESAVPDSATRPERSSPPMPQAVMPSPEPVSTPAAKVVETLQGWPVLIAAGTEFKHQFPFEKGKLEIQLVDGPPGMKIDSAGLLTWMPASKEVGQHELKLRVEQSSGPFFERPKVEVVSSELAKSVNGDLTRVNQFESFDLDTDHYAVTSGSDRKSLLLLQGRTLRILKADGISIERKVELPHRYHDIEERQDVYVAVSSKPPFLDVIDKKSLKVLSHVELVFPDFKVLEVTDLSIHPAEALSYVCVKNGIELPRYTVLFVDENSGSVRVPGIVGTWAEVSPDGQTLYTGYRDLYEKGMRFHINPGWRLIEIPEYGNVDMLLAWTANEAKPSLQKIVRQAGGNGKGIRLAPDGSRIVYLSHVGTPMHSNNLVGFETSDFETGEVHYTTKDRASTKEAAFHPNLPWVAMPGTGSVTIFQQDTGDVIENRLLATVGGLGTEAIERMFFSPDGRSILLLRSGGESGRYLQCIPLILDDSEIAAPPRTQKPKLSPMAKTQAAPRNELHSLKAKAEDVPVAPQQIGRDFMNSVVVVRTERSSGSGFVVGDNGYVLTCAHVVADGSPLFVEYNTVGQQDSSTSEAAELIRIDHDKDIALLKFTPEKPLTSVRFRDDQLMEAGEPVTVIGNPGAGNSILSRTMTNGIVSNPNRELDGKFFIQLSAAVNPGNSGGPLFDQHGNVAGLIALKANIEGASFAVPSEALKKFMRDAASDK